MRSTAMTRRTTLPASLAAGVALLGAVASEARGKGAKKIPLEEARIFFEYNSSARDLGAQVFLDGESWKRLKIVGPNGTIFEVEGKGSLKKTGLTELSFEGEEPSLDEVPIEEFLARFPEGEYQFVGKTVEGQNLVGRATLTHAVPAGPSNVSAAVGSNNSLIISWGPVTGPAKDFPDEPIVIVGYQVIVDRVNPQPLRVFSVDLPATATKVTVSPEFIQANAEYRFEVLAIEAGGNQTISQSTFKSKSP